MHLLSVGLALIVAYIFAVFTFVAIHIQHNLVAVITVLRREEFLFAKPVLYGMYHVATGGSR